MTSTVIFDLDGTISDPAQGITRSINHALMKLGQPIHPEAELLKYIGPHLNVIFSELMGTRDEVILLHAIELYRERYISVGFRENWLYDGVLEVLSLLRSKGSSLCIATSKRRDIALSVLEFLGVESFFSQVHGCDLHRSKTDLLHDIISDATLGAKPMVMIGDRFTDFEAAAEVGMPSIAVRWGYGEENELEMATVIAEMPADLPELVERTAQPVVLRNVL